jgi:hypothetical protein
LHIACKSGELVSIALDTGEIVRHDFGLDLRDVMIFDMAIQVSRFRSADIITIPRTNGTGLSNQLAWGEPSVQSGDGADLAWRSVAAPGQSKTDPAGPMVVAQQPTPEPVNPAPGGYGGSSSLQDVSAPECGAKGILSTIVTMGSGPGLSLPEAVLPVDLATNGRDVVIVAAGNAFTKDLPQLFITSRGALMTSETGTRTCIETVHGNVPGQAIAAAFDGRDELIVQTREPAALFIMTEDRRRPWKTITLSDISRQDTGHAVFHANAGGFIACASCHAEGGDDGHVWEFVGEGRRRTPSLAGTLEGTQPYHWAGEMTDLRMLVDKVFVERMSGPPLDDDHLDAMRTWLFAQPAPTPIRAASEASARGQTLFRERCSACHAGSHLTNNQTVDVGTGGQFQVPSLIGVGWRAPYLHMGCATSLPERFDPACGGDKHADTHDLSHDQIQDLVQFLQTL